MGSNQTIRVNVRVIAATNQDLGQLVATKQFRADLYYRLNVIPLALPPLRNRPEDIPLLVEHFVRKFSTRMDKPIDVVPPEVMEVLERHSWPGNIRELQNFIERAVVLSPGSVLRPTLTDLTSMTGTTKPSATNIAHTLETATREFILAVLEQTHWTVGGPEGAAVRLGLARTTLLYKMRKLGIEPRRTQRCPFIPTMIGGKVSPVGSAVGA